MFIGAPLLYYARKVLPIVKSLPKSDRRVTRVDMLRKMATGTPTWLLIVGVIAGAGMVTMSGFNLVLHYRLAVDWVPQALTMFNGLFLTAYFSMLLHIRSKPQDS
jgi:hypothetical protein